MTLLLTILLIGSALGVDSNSSIFDIKPFHKLTEGVLESGKVIVHYRTLNINDALDLLRIGLTIPAPRMYMNYGNEPIIEMTVSNGRDSVLISLPVVYPNGQLGWTDGKLLDPITPEDLQFRKKKGSKNKTLIITLQSRLNVDINYTLNSNTLDRSQYVVRFPRESSTQKFSDHVSFIKPVGLYINSIKQNISNLKLTVTSDDDTCATLVTAPHNISIYKRSDELDKNERRLTFTRRADVYFSETELEKYSDFRVFVFVNPNDEECNPANKRRNQNRNKKLNFEFEKVDNSHYFLPIVWLFSVFLIPVVALLGYIVFKSNSHKPVPNLISMDDPIEQQTSPIDRVEVKEPDSVFNHRGVLKYPIAIILPVFMHMSTEYHKFTTTSMANLDEICFHNHACAKPWWDFRAFNNIISNVGYLIFGCLFILFSLQRRYWKSQKKDCGIFESVLLDVTIGVFLMMQALGSATYHICPSDTAFQFDTPCIQVICGLLIIRQCSIRHHTPSPSYSNSLLVAVFVTNLAISSLSEYSKIRVLIAIAHAISTSMFVKFKYSSLRNASLDVQSKRPMFVGTFVTLNLCLMFIYCIFTGVVHLNQIVTFTMIFNCATYLIYYTLMKVFLNEKITRFAQIFGGLAIIFWSLALFCYLQDGTDWTMTPARSRALNKPCILFNFFGSHDLWHIFSAFSTLFTFLYVAFVDDSLNNFPRISLNVV